MSIMKPIIGINCDYEWEGKRVYSFLNREYVDSIITAGGIPLLLPIIKAETDVDALLQHIDGLLLTGGDDVMPYRYGQQQHAKTVCVHPDKDISDNILVQVAIRMEKPILAICYGAQLINVFFGGTLIQDISSEMSSPIVHHVSNNEFYTHPVTIQTGTLLRHIIGEDNVDTNSIHHQAVGILGKDLIVAAQSSDGVIEAIEHKNYPFLVGVQWHPERMIEYPHHKALFNALIAAAKSFQSAPKSGGFA